MTERIKQQDVPEQGGKADRETRLVVKNPSQKLLQDLLYIPDYMRKSLNRSSSVTLCAGKDYSELRELFEKGLDDEILREIEWFNQRQIAPLSSIVYQGADLSDPYKQHYHVSAVGYQAIYIGSKNPEIIEEAIEDAQIEGTQAGNFQTVDIRTIFDSDTLKKKIIDPLNNNSGDEDAIGSHKIRRMGIGFSSRAGENTSYSHLRYNANWSEGPELSFITSQPEGIGAIGLDWSKSEIQGEEFSWKDRFEEYNLYIYKLINAANPTK